MRKGYTTILLLTSIILLTAACLGVRATPQAMPTLPAPRYQPGAILSPALVTADGLTLAATYYSPTADPAPGILLLHMLGRDRSDWHDFALQLQQAGYAVLAIDLRGHGESEGSRDYTLMERDAAAGIRFLRDQPQIDANRLLIIGASIGANIALRYAASDPDIAGVVLLSPGLDYRQVTTADAMPAYGERPILIAASSEDSYAADSARQLDSLAAGPHQLLIYDGQGHGTRMLGKGNGLETAILDWLRSLGS